MLEQLLDIGDAEQFDDNRQRGPVEAVHHVPGLHRDAGGVGRMAWIEAGYFRLLDPGG